MTELDPLSKWLLGLVGLAVTGLLVFLAKFVFSNSASRLETVVAKQQVQDTQLATGAQAFAHLREMLQRVEDRMAKQDERLTRIERRMPPRKEED